MKLTMQERKAVINIQSTPHLESIPYIYYRSNKICRNFRMTYACNQMKNMLKKLNSNSLPGQLGCVWELT